MDKLYLESSYILVILDFTGVASTINREFDIIFVNGLSS